MIWSGPGEDDGGFAGAVEAVEGEVVDFREECRVEDGGGGALGGELAVVEEEEFVGEGGGEVEVVAGGEDREVLFAGKLAEPSAAPLGFEWTSAGAVVPLAGFYLFTAFGARQESTGGQALKRAA